MVAGYEDSGGARGKVINARQFFSPEVVVCQVRLLKWLVCLALLAVAVPVRAEATDAYIVLTVEGQQADELELVVRELLGRIGVAVEGQTRQQLPLLLIRVELTGSDGRFEAVKPDDEQLLSAKSYQQQSPELLREELAHGLQALTEAVFLGLPVPEELTAEPAAEAPAEQPKAAPAPEPKPQPEPKREPQAPPAEPRESLNGADDGVQRWAFGVGVLSAYQGALIQPALDIGIGYQQGSAWPTIWLTARAALPQTLGRLDGELSLQHLSVRGWAAFRLPTPVSFAVGPSASVGYESGTLGAAEAAVTSGVQSAVVTSVGLRARAGWELAANWLLALDAELNYLPRPPEYFVEASAERIVLLRPTAFQPAAGVALTRQF